MRSTTPAPDMQAVLDAMANLLTVPDIGTGRIIAMNRAAEDLRATITRGAAD